MARTMREIMNRASGKAPLERCIFFYVDKGDYIAEAMVSLMLGEAKKHVDLGQGRDLYFHKAHIPNTEDHLHFYQKGAHLYALNKDGTAHDKSHGKQMARWAKEATKMHYPDFLIPKDGLIEQMIEGQDDSLLLEADGATKRHMIPQALMLSAITAAARA